MNWTRLARVAAPAASPLSLDAAKAHLKVDGSAQDVEVQQLVDAAVAVIDGPQGIGIAMVDQTWRLSLDGLPSRVVIPLSPVLALVDVTYLDPAGDLQTLGGDVYRLDADQNPAVITLAPGKSLPATLNQPGCVKVKFRAGFGAAADVPADLVAALKLIIGNLFDNRDGGETPAVKAILDRYRAPGFA